MKNAALGKGLGAGGKKLSGRAKSDTSTYLKVLMVVLQVRVRPAEKNVA